MQAGDGNKKKAHQRPPNIVLPCIIPLSFLEAHQAKLGCQGNKCCKLPKSNLRPHLTFLSLFVCSRQAHKCHGHNLSKSKDVCAENRGVFHFPSQFRDTDTKKEPIQQLPVCARMIIARDFMKTDCLVLSVNRFYWLTTMHPL